MQARPLQGNGVNGSSLMPAWNAPVVIKLPLEQVASTASSQWPATVVRFTPLTVIVETWVVLVGLLGSDPSKLKPSPIRISAVKPAGNAGKLTVRVSPAELENPSAMMAVRTSPVPVW